MLNYNIIKNRSNSSGVGSTIECANSNNVTNVLVVPNSLYLSQSTSSSPASSTTFNPSSSPLIILMSEKQFQVKQKLIPRYILFCYLEVICFVYCLNKKKLILN